MKKYGISLITCVITIVIISVISSAILITLSNTGILDKATEALNRYNDKHGQISEGLDFIDSFLNNDVPGDDEQDEEVKLTSTLGELVTSAADYGRKINYEANGVNDWKVFYEDEASGYVYLITSEKLEYDKVPKELETKAGATIDAATIELGENDNKTVGQIYWEVGNVPTKAATIQNSTMWMANWSNYNIGLNGRCVSYFLDETYWENFKNTTKYLDSDGKEYVLGAIGTPTAEMFVASWNAKRLTEENTDKKKLALVVNGNGGYSVNDITTSNSLDKDIYYQELATTDPLYFWSTKSDTAVWLASPSGHYPTYADRLLFLYHKTGVYNCYNATFYGVRPLVCISASIPAGLAKDGSFVI